MLVEVLKSKIHRVKVTQAELHYVGSITIDEALLEAAQMFENQKVQIVNIDNGERIETYIIKGKRGSGEICLNGPAARRVQVGDTIIIIAYGLLPLGEAQSYKPVVIFPDEHNRV
ncbi:aspartate 1-decarboxylase [Eisenibacter elegans]|jgi:aspartate 1-decarboxylase|uniref:aspartate 1-decarboxylase n=1 Tax=Eisenibacter elegans TaxID=997 RepID=UPI0004142115|nr:aspartate 1-decarboxylase [Eisenibacter elegans]